MRDCSGIALITLKYQSILNRDSTLNHILIYEIYFYQYYILLQNGMCSYFFKTDISILYHKKKIHEKLTRKQEKMKIKLWNEFRIFMWFSDSFLFIFFFWLMVWGEKFSIEFFGKLTNLSDFLYNIFYSVELNCGAIVSWFTAELFYSKIYFIFLNF